MSRPLPDERSIPRFTMQLSREELGLELNDLLPRFVLMPIANGCCPMFQYILHQFLGHFLGESSSRGKGYDDDEVRESLAKCGFTAHIRARGEEAHAITREAGYKARRWAVEHTHGGMNRFRRVPVRWDRNVRNDLAFLHLACAALILRQSGLLG